MKSFFNLILIEQTFRKQEKNFKPWLTHSIDIQGFAKVWNEVCESYLLSVFLIIQLI